MFRRALISLAFVLLFPALLHAAQFNLDTPSPGSFVSGLGYIAGWKCTGGSFTFSIDGGAQAPLVYRITRSDTQSDCRDSNNGFLAQFNWNLVSTGQHTIRVYDNGQQFAQATFTVTTLGTEFLTGQSATCTTSLAGKEVTLTWEENQQNFAITGAGGGGGEFSGTYSILASKISDTCSLSEGGGTDTLTVTQSGSALTGAILVSGNFPDGVVTVSIDRRQVSGACPSSVNCDVILNGTLTKTAALQYDISESVPVGEGSSVDELINALLE